MYELAWFVAGTATALAVVRLLRARAGSPTGSPPGSPTGNPTGSLTGNPTGNAAVDAAPAVPAGTSLTPPLVTANARRVALSLAEELANLVSGVEGRAHHLIVAAPNRAHLPPAAEALLASVLRLRTLHKKLVAFGRARLVVPGSTEISTLVSGLTDDLQQMQLGLELSWEPPSALPPIAADPDIVRDALLFLCAALLRAERGATHLSIQAELVFAGETPSIRLELVLEWITETLAATADALADTNLALDLEAAHNLIACQGGDVLITHLPGRSVRAVVHWPAALPAEVFDAEPAGDAEDTATTVPTPLDLPDEGEPAGHRYRGALVLEADPSVRAMLASELKASGRAVFACADGAAARSFLEATPDRFELLIVDHHQRLDGGDALGQTIKTLAPDLKICVLGQGPKPAGGLWPQLHCIQKPFGVHELRRALASVLAG